MAEEDQERFDKLFWSYNCPLQMWPTEDGTWRVLNYMPRKERIATFDDRVTKEELPSFCKNTARILRNLAGLFDALAVGKIDLIYYPDKDLDVAISDREKEIKKAE
jgi:hypothetical protein